MHQAFAKRVIGIDIVAVDNSLRHHHVLRGGALFVRLRLQCLLRALGGRVPRVIGARAQFLLAVRVAARVTVVACVVVAPVVGAEAGLPHGMKRTLLAVVVFPTPFPRRNDAVVFLIELSVLWKHLIRFHSRIMTVG